MRKKAKKNLVRVGVYELTVGMYVDSFDVSWFDHPFILPRKGLIRSENQIRELIYGRIHAVFVDPDKSQFDLPAERIEGEEELALVSLESEERRSVRAAREEVSPPPARAVREVARPERVQPMREETPLRKELPVAYKIYNEALNFVGYYQDRIIRAESFEPGEALQVVEKMAKSLFRNYKALSTMPNVSQNGDYFRTHAVNTAIYAMLLGLQSEIDEERFISLGICGLYHDLGMLYVPDDLLNKPGRYTQEERERVKSHPEQGYGYLKDGKGIKSEVARGVLDHHERMDGSGYPRGIFGDKIGTIGKLMGMADVYDALTSKRPFREAVPHQEALGMIYKWRKTVFPPTLVDLFIKAIGVYPAGTLVELDSGKLGLVTEVYSSYPKAPRLRTLIKTDKGIGLGEEIDLIRFEGKYGVTRPEIVDAVNPRGIGLDLTELRLRAFGLKT